MKLLQFRIWGGKVDYNHSMYVWASDADIAFFGIARRIDPSVTAHQWTGKEISTNEVLEAIKDKKSFKNDSDTCIRGFECERFGTVATITKTYDCMLDGSDKRAAEEAWKCFQKISEENPESHIKLTTHRGGSKIEFLI